MSEVLQGVRVIEHGTFITGPAAGMLLADLGADVVKEEIPGSTAPPLLGEHDDVSRDGWAAASGQTPYGKETDR